jgi:hypothetical protein
MGDCLARSLRSWVALSHWSSAACVHVRCGSNSRSTRLTWGRVIWGIFFPPVLLQGQQKGGGEQGQGAVMVPAGPTAHLVLVQACLTFGRFELGFNDPAGRRDLGQGQQGRVLGGVGQVRARLTAIAMAPQQQPAGATGQTVAAFPDTQGDKLVGAWSVRPLGHGQVLPGRGGRLAATAWTVWGAGAPGTRRTLLGLGPRPDHGGTAVTAA